MKRPLNFAVKIGNPHVKHGMPCQDRAVAVRDNDLVVLAVADGMGSCRHADLGAEFAVTYVKEHGKSLIVWVESEEKVFVKELKKFMFKLTDDMVGYAFTRKISPDDLHCTLSFSLIDSEHFINVSIGDSPLYTLTKNGPMFLDGNDKGSDRVNLNQTYSVLEVPHAFEKVEYQIGDTKDLISILITSDGALGWSKQKELLNSKNFGDLPAWYYDMLIEKKNLKTVVKKLVNDGYDDVGAAYYVHDESLIHTKQKRTA
jgi:serine/threonine protein phosphatase PrpC